MWLTHYSGTSQPAPQHRAEQGQSSRMPASCPGARAPHSHLVSSTDVLFVSVQMDALGDVWGLLLQRHEHIAGLEVKAWAEGKQAKGGHVRHRAAASDQPTGDVQFLACTCGGRGVSG